MKSALSKVSAAKAFVCRKQRNSKTGERIASWVKEILSVLETTDQKDLAASSSLQQADMSRFCLVKMNQKISKVLTASVLIALARFHLCPPKLEAWIKSQKKFRRP